MVTQMNLVKSQLHLRRNNKQWKYYWTTNEQPEGIVYGNTNAIPSLGKETGIYKQLYVHTKTLWCDGQGQGTFKTSHNNNYDWHKQ